MATVFIACKAANGIVIRGDRMIDATEPSPNGARPIKKAVAFGKEYPVRGPAHPYGIAPPGLLHNGYAITGGVDAEVWDAWYASNKDGDLVRNNMIAAFAKEAELIAWTKAFAETVSGMEPVDPTRLDREYRGMPGRMSPLQQAPESNKPML